MGFDEGQIVLNSDNGTYYPGQILYGRLEFHLEKDKKCRGIYAEIIGNCKIHWTTRHSRRVNNRTEHYTITHKSHEEYMNMTIYFIGSKDGEQVLHPGQHVFPFECQIPAHCPSSFYVAKGRIKYKVKVTVDRPFKIDQTMEKEFRVLAPLDLNTNPDAKEPIAFEFEQTFCCWCMNAGLAETVVKLPASGFCPKQLIPIEVACTNKSSVEIDPIKFSILKKTTLVAEEKPDTWSDEEVIATLKKGPVPGNTTRNWTVEMEVPDFDPLNVATCRFITIEYTFKVEIGTSGCHTDEDESRPIFIGTIPLRSLQYPPNSNFETPNITPGVTAYPAGPIVNQPLPNIAPYPGNHPYPSGNSPYPGVNPPYPGANPPYPDGNSPYPGRNSPYPGGNPPYPGANPPYPGNTPNIGFATPEQPPYPTVSPHTTPSPNPVSSNPPYPVGNGGNSPFVTAQHVNSAPYPNSGINSPHPGQNSTSPPYPAESNIGSNLPYPTTPNASVGANSQPTSSSYPNNSPYSSNVPGLKTGTIGFTHGPNETMPLLPPGAMPQPTSPYVSASAPPPSTPDDENKKLAENIPPQ